MTFMPHFFQPEKGMFNKHHKSVETELLRQQSEDGLSHRLSEIELAAPDSIYRARLASELEIIAKKGVCAYFLIVADYVKWARGNGIAVGPGRGSGPCSLVGYSLGITNTDPIKYGLPFERFLNPDRTTVPDFDLDFCDERRGEVVTYIQSKYGADRVAQISSDQNKPLLSRLVIADRPLAELASLYTDPDSGFPTIDITLRHIADAGLVQFNAINQIALTLIQRAVQDLAKTGIIIDIDKIGLDDERTFHLLSAGELSNIPILDDEHYKTTLIAVRPDNFKDLCAVIALCQPRLRGSIPMYVERKRSHPSTHCFHSALKSITQETYGLILYQEQVMHIAHKIAGFSMAQGDLFRRSLRKTDHKAVGVYKNKFIQGALNFGMSRSEASGMFEYVATSGQNSFNKSHAVAYAMLAYQTAWLKANFHND